MVMENELHNYYYTNTILKRKEGFSIDELENMLPWERQYYIDLINEQIEEDNKRSQ